MAVSAACLPSWRKASLAPSSSYLRASCSLYFLKASSLAWYLPVSSSSLALYPGMMSLSFLMAASRSSMESRSFFAASTSLSIFCFSSCMLSMASSRILSSLFWAAVWSSVFLVRSISTVTSKAAPAATAAHGLAARTAHSFFREPFTTSVQKAFSLSAMIALLTATVYTVRATVSALSVVLCSMAN